jgi:putative ABC transport system substrate-binding protein
MRRREFITLFGGAAGWPIIARAQQPAQIKRLGILSGTVESSAQADSRVLLERLASLGWAEGRNLRVDYRGADTFDRAVIRSHAEALVRAAPDVIVALFAPAVQALQPLTRTIPIVFVQNGDPVLAGTVESLARPGGNLTGFTQYEPSLNTKLLQLLKDIAPQITRIGVIESQAVTWRKDFEQIESAAPSFSIAATALLVRDDADAADIERAITRFAQEPKGGLILPPNNVATQHRALIVELTAKHQLPAIYASRGFIEAGGLMYYNATPMDYRRIAEYVDRVLRGTKPADLPVETPTKFELVINVKIATALGLTIPLGLLAIADKVIE